MKKIGIVLLLLSLGILGIFLPLLPGIPFLVALLYVLGIIDKKRMLRLLKRFQGRKGSFQRKIVACLIIRLIYRRKLNLKYG